MYFFKFFKFFTFSLLIAVENRWHFKEEKYKRTFLQHANSLMSFFANLNFSLHCANSCKRNVRDKFSTCAFKIVSFILFSFKYWLLYCILYPLIFLFSFWTLTELYWQLYCLQVAWEYFALFSASRFFLVFSVFSSNMPKFSKLYNMYGKFYCKTIIFRSVLFDVFCAIFFCN